MLKNALSLNHATTKSYLNKETLPQTKRDIFAYKKGKKKLWL